VNRIIIWKNFEDNGLCARQLYEWFEGVPAQRDKRPMQHLVYEEDAPTWLAISKERKNINRLVKDFTPKEQVRIKARGAVSLLGIPLFFKGEFWGFISFDDCKKERVFTAQEESILHSASILIISAILKNDTTLSLIKSREDAVAGSKAKSDFLSRMSHEIRTPMNAIIGMTTIAKRSGDALRMRYCLDKVEGASKQLLGLINDILDMSKIEADKFEIVPKEFNFEKIVQNAVNVIQVKLEEKHQQIVVDFDKMFERLVISDELRFSQVLLNLLSNANKFTPDDGRITVKIRQTVLDKEHVKLHGEVIDTGIGISPEQQARLFSSFEQADGTITRRFGGTGLGLALCKKILNLMGGDIWIQSELGKGAAFIFELDVSLGGMIGGAKAQNVPLDTRILVIDDSDDVREYFSHILASFSIACDTEASGKAGIDSLRKAAQTGVPYNIVFLDWKLLGEDCVEVAKTIQGIAGPGTALVLMSVADWTDIESNFQTVKINRFLSKPVLPSTLYDTIVNVSDPIGISEQQADPVTDLAGKLSGKTILVAEDIEINQEILASILEDTGVSLEFALNGVIAVEMFKKKQYDLVLMDVQMPELDGLGATRTVRRLGTKAAVDIPIIAMTANAFNEDVEACLEAGMSGHLAKPIDVDELMEALGKWLL
jgi:signal transduction histidine kinase/DNA-binding response OmpR family regulator